MDEAEQKALSDIQTYGCHVIHVLADGDQPPFSYSVGVWKSVNAPEIIIVGLKQEIAHFVVNEYNRRVKEGARFHDGDTSSGFLEGFQCLFREMDKQNYASYLGWDRWLYRGNEFPALQLIYPTTTGVWPWEPDASDWFRNRQTLLYPPPAG